MSEPWQGDFAAIFASALHEVGEARVALAERTLGGPAPIGPVARLGPVSFTWRHRFAQQRDRRLFLFIRRPDEDAVVFDNRLRWQEHPTPIPLDPTPAPPLRWEYVLRGPSFLAPPPTPPTLHAPGIAAVSSSSQNGPMRFTLPDGRELRVLPPGPAGKPRRKPPRGPRHDRPSPVAPPPEPWRLETSGSAPDVAAVAHHAPTAPAWPLELVNAWLTGLRRARTEDETDLQAHPRPLPGLDSGSWVDRFLAALIQGYADADRHGRQPRRPGGHDALGFAQTIGEFAGEIDLRLTPDGEDLASIDEEDAITTRLSYSIIRLGNTARLTVRLHPPDAIVDGETRSKLIDAFADSIEAQNIDVGLGKKATPAVARAWVERLRSRPDEALLLRIGDQDDLLLSLPAADGEPAALLRARAADPSLASPDSPGPKLRSATPGTPRRRNPLGKGGASSVRPPERPPVALIRPDAGDTNDPHDDSLLADTQGIFLGLMRTLHRWGGLLP